MRACRAPRVAMDSEPMPIDLWLDVCMRVDTNPYSYQCVLIVDRYGY